MGTGLLHLDLHAVGVEHLHAVHRAEEAPHARLRGRVHEAVDAELHRRGVDLGPVVEEDVLAQLEGVEQAVGRHLPRLGGITDELAVGRDVDEPAADVHRDPHHFVAGGRVEIQVGDLIAIGHAQRPTTFWRLRHGHS